MLREREGCASTEGAKQCLQEGQIMIFKKVDVWLMPVQHLMEAKAMQLQKPRMTSLNHKVISIH